MKVLVVGAGGREHAIASALVRTSDCKIYTVMSKANPGLIDLSIATLIAKETDINLILDFCMSHSIDYAFIGPESPLEVGISDGLISAGIKCIGPTQAAAKIETNKAFCREIMSKYKIPGLPEYHIFSDPYAAEQFIHESADDYAIKPIGLTGGKGVRIIGEHLTHQEATHYIRDLKGVVVIEERLIGEEFTIQAFVDGIHLIPMPIVQDHKRAYEGDIGPNTGGMGAYSMPNHRLPFISEEIYNQALGVMHLVIDALRAEGTIYKGILYGQFMITSKGLIVIEFNARFGDPEAMNVLSLLNTDMTKIMQAIWEGHLDQIMINFDSKATVCKYLVPEGYPDNPVINAPIYPGSGKDALLYYASVIRDKDHLVTQSSRTMAYVGIGNTLAEAETIAETAAAAVSGSVRYRKDIGTTALLEKRIKHVLELK